MSASDSGSDAYSVQMDTDDGQTIADDTIITLDAHNEEPLSPHPAYNHPQLTSEDLKTVAIELNDVGKQDLAVDIDHERQALENNPEHEPTYTAIELNGLVIALAIARTKCVYDEDMDGALAIGRFGRVINESAETVLADGAQWMDIPGLRPAKADDNQDYINPFDVIVGDQTLSFVDTRGNRLTPDDLHESEDSSIVTGN